MDFRHLQEIAITIYHNMRADGIRVDGIILFGSHAKGVATDESDIDLAILSRDLGIDRFKEGALVNIYASRVDHRAEAIPLSVHEFFERFPVSPILAEVQKDGIFLV